VDDIAARTSAHGIGAFSVTQDVVAFATFEQIVPVCPGDGVVPLAAE
jgi:hypothetical protein